MFLSLLFLPSSTSTLKSDSDTTHVTANVKEYARAHDTAPAIFYARAHAIAHTTRAQRYSSL